MGVPAVNVQEAHKRLSSAEPPRLIDVREKEEWDVSRIEGAELLPLSEWPEVAMKVLADKDQPLLIHCHHGGRSARAVSWLLEQGFTNVQNVDGGIDAWSQHVDPAVPRYQ